jgi:hypothetical protein
MTLKIRTASRNLKVLLNLMYNTFWCIYVAAVTYLALFLQVNLAPG